MKYILIVFLVTSITSMAFAKANTPGSYYVTADRLSVRLGPSKSAKITNVLDRRQRVDVYQIQNGWARISEYYDGKWEGIAGEVARWVSADYLNEEAPAKRVPKNADNSPIAKAIESSDDYYKYSVTMIKASTSLIEKGKCTLSDLKGMGGWMRSSNHKPKPVYFTYCGGMKRINRIYLNVQTREIFK